MALFNRKPPATQVGGESFAYTGGKRGIWVSVYPKDARYEVFLEGEKDTTYLYGVDREHKTSDRVVDSCLIGRAMASGWHLVAPGMDGSPRWFPFVTGRCRIAWSPDKPKAWLLVDGVQVASFDFEEQRCWAASAFPRPTEWTKGTKDWTAEAMAGWTS